MDDVPDITREAANPEKTPSSEAAASDMAAAGDIVTAAADNAAAPEAQPAAVTGTGGEARTEAQDAEPPAPAAAGAEEPALEEQPFPDVPAAPAQEPMPAAAAPDAQAPASDAEAPAPAAAAAGTETVEPATSASAIYRVKILYCSATEFCQIPPGIQISAGDTVVVPTKYGHEIGRVLGLEPPPVDCSAEELKTIVRKATPNDMSRVGENELKQEKAFEACREKIALRGLEMKLVSAHYLLDEQKILFFFTAENRIDFRELVKDLVAIFKTRIELRQIGVRDEARVLGGVGICGRVLCCNSITDRLRPVSIKMAKEQNLTLNSMKISGPCGRLLCCLSYEFDVYKEARQHFPPQGTRIPYDGESFKVAEINVLARRLRLQGESGRVLDLGFDGLTKNPKTNTWEIRVRTANGQ